MEQDIKILEELRKELGLYTDGKKIRQGIALEHLIKAYKEREEEMNKINQQLDLDYVDKNFIPVSLVEEKIEELDKEEQELQNSISDEEREEYSDANISFELMDIEIRRSVLQELLEKRK